MMAVRRIPAALALAAGVLVGAALPAIAQEEDADQRFRVDGETLYFDTTLPVDGRELDIRFSDVERMREVLRLNRGVTRLVINSAGGGHYPAMDLAAVVIDFELDTHVADLCESSCVPVFLGGVRRTMEKGARIGFHQLSWNDAAVEEYYNKHRERREWNDPFDFAEWMYADTQTETYNRLSYMVRRGVDAGFAIRTIRKPDTSMWFPYRAELRAAGVLTE